MRAELITPEGNFTHFTVLRAQLKVGEHITLFIKLSDAADTEQKRIALEGTGTDVATLLHALADGTIAPVQQWIDASVSPALADEEELKQLQTRIEELRSKKALRNPVNAHQGERGVNRGRGRGRG